MLHHGIDCNAFYGMLQNLLHYFLGVYPMLLLVSLESVESMRIDALMQKGAKCR
jgi:hypothetical protein